MDRVTTKILLGLALLLLPAAAAAQTAPVVSDIPDQTIDEGATFTTINLDDFVSDAESPDSAMGWTFSGNTELTVSIDINRVATITIPSVDWNGAETITFTAEDPDLLTGSDAATFTVNAVNDAPVVAGIPDQTIDEGATFTTVSLDDYVTDVDNIDADMTWTFSGNTELTVSIDINRVATITIPSVDWNGAETITFTAEDPDLLTGSDAATFTVNAVNDAPVVAGIPDQTIDEGATFTTVSLDDYVTDVDNIDADMTWTFSGNSSLSVVIDANRVATITTPSANWNGSETITFRATDPGSEFGEDAAVFTVNAVNDAPVVADIPDQTVAEGATFTTINLDNYISDVDNIDTDIDWTFSGNTELTVSIDVNRVATITIPDAEWSGSETITFTATDPGLLADSDAATFTVTAVNDAPVVTDIPDQTVAEGATLTTVNLDDFVSDIDNLDSEMDWTFSGNTELSVVIDVNRVATITIPDADWNGAETITFTATDPGLLSDADAATFTVTAVNDAPVVADITDQTLAEGATFASINLDNFVSDVDNVDADMTWSFSGNTELTVSIVNRVANISIPNADWNGAETITFTATDPGLLADSDAAVFTVTAVNDAPEVADIPNQTIDEGGTFTTIALDDYVADVDNLDSEIDWTFAGNTELTVTIDVNRVATITTPSADWNGAETITFTATDPGLLAASDDAVFTVNAVNDAPVVTDIPDQTVTEGETFATIDLDDFVSDVDNIDADMTWSVSGNTELDVTIDAGRVATITMPNADWNGAETITFTATDPGLLFGSDAATFTVTGVNDAPVVADITDQTIDEGSTFATVNLDDFVSDVDNADSEIDWVATGNSELSVSIDVNRVATITIPDANWNGAETITFTATDPGLLSDADAATFTVNAVNDAPVVADIPDQTVAEGTSFTAIDLNSYVSDIDNLISELTWSYSGNSELSVSIVNNTAFVSAPTANWNGSESITFTATDPGLLSGSDPATFTVTGVNDAPVVANIPDQTIAEGESFATISLDSYVSDIDNLDSEMSWSYSGNSQLTVTIDANRVATVTTPSEFYNGAETITFTATDPGLLNSSDAATFTVSAVNNSPIVTDIPDQTIAEGGSFTTINLDDFVSDVDNADSEIIWTYSGNTDLSVTIDVNRVATVTTPDADWNGSELITFTATDPSGLSNSNAATFAVTPVNDAPVVAGIPDQTIDEGLTFATINLDSYVTDIDNLDSELDWSYSGNTELTVTIDASRIATITIPNINWNGSETITFTATDPGTLADSDGATFTVNGINDGPVVSNIPNQSVAEGASFAAINLDDFVADIDNLDGEITWTASGNTELIVSIDAGRVATVTAPNADWNGSETITFTATDPGLLFDSDAATFTVSPVNDAPVVLDIPDQTISEGQSFASINLDEYAADIDNADAELTWSYSGNTELSVSIVNRLAIITTPSSEWNGSETITFTAEDPGLLTGSNSATFTVTAENDGPNVLNIPNQSIAEGETFATINLDSYVSDIDNLPSEISWSYLGNTQLTVTIDASRIATISVPNADWNGSETITFTATDPGLLSDSDPATFTVTAINDAPVVADIPDQTIDEGTSFATIDLDAYVNDVDNLDSDINWSFSGNSELSVTIDANRVATIGVPSSSWNGSETITFTATDPGLLFNSDAATFTVNAVNNAPVVSNIPDQTIAEGAIFTTINLDDFVVDSDNLDGEISWSYFGNTELDVNIDANRVATIATPTVNWNGSETITFTATDPGLLSDSDPATFTVTAVNDAPLVSDIPNQTIAEGETFATIPLDNYVSDIDNADNEMTWSFSGNSSLSVTIDVNRVATITTPSPTWNGSETIIFTATDPGLLNDSEPATFTVTAVNNAPVVTDIPNQTIPEGGSFTTIDLDDYVSDVDNLDSEIDWTYSGNTELTVSIDANRVATITTPTPDWNGSEQITFTATDPSLLSNSDAATFAVTAINDPPVVADIPNQTVPEGSNFTAINLDDFVSDVDNLIADLTWSYSGNVALSVEIINRVAIVSTPSPDWSGVESISFRATDPDGLSDFDNAIFTVTAVNDAPVVTNIPSQTIDEGASFTTINLNDFVSDVDNLDSEMDWTFEGNTALSVSLDVNRVATISIPSADWNGSEVITFIATDPGGLSDSDPATFTVNAVNDAPVVADIPDQTVNEGQTFTTIALDNFVSDIDNLDNQITWTFAGNSELSVTIDGSRIATIGIPSADWNGSETITFTATDPGLLTDSDAATFTVTAVNNPPVVTNIPNQTISEGLTFASINLDDYVSDVDNLDSEMSWTYSGNTELIVSIDVNRVATITTPSPDWFGNETITFTASDPGLLSDSDPATFTVTGENDAPVVSNIPSQTIAEGESFTTISLDTYVSDVDNLDSEISWSVSSNTELTVSIDVNRVATVTTPSPTWNGAETITFTATDPGLLTASDAATFTVSSVNNAPVVTNIPDQTVAEGNTFTTINLDDFVSDVDNADSEIDWTFSGNSELGVTIDINRVATISIPDANWFGSEQITFTATDPSLLSNSDAATFTVTAVNDAPVVADIPNQTVAEGALFASINLDNYVSDVDNLDEQISWTFSGNTQLSVSITNRVAIVTAPNSDWNGSETITFTATDPGTLSDFDAATFTVTAVNDNPNVTDIPNQSIAEGETFASFSLDDYVSDVDNLDSELSWSWSGNSALSVSIDVNRTVTVTVPNADWNGTETITFTATDPGGEFDSDPAIFTVAGVNDAPVVSDIPDQTIDEGATFATIDLNTYVADVDNADSEINWTYAGNTELTVSIDANRIATVTVPGPTWNGAETITFTATDPGLLADSDPATFTVTAVNDAPVVSDIPNQTVSEGTAFATISLDSYVSDIDNVASDMVWTYSGNSELSVNIDASRIATITIPDADWNGSETITFTATDPGGLFDSDDASFTVTGVNDGPIVADIPDQTIAEGASFATVNLDDFVSDIDNLDSEIGWTASGNTELSVNIDANRVATITTPSPNWNGSETITFTATDPGLLTSSDEATFTVTAVNNAPVVADIPGQTIAEGESFTTISLDAFVSDIDNADSEISWSFSGNTALVVSIDVNRVATISTPNADWNGTETITFTATDPGLLTDSDDATFTVTGVNDAPVITDIPNQTIAEGASFTAIDLNTYVSDIDNADNEINWSFSGNTELTVAIDVNRIATITTPSPTWNGSETVTFTATDPGLLADSDAATFTVSAVNNAPVVSDIPNQSIAEGGTFTTISLDNFVTDVDNADSEISWTYSGNVDLTVDIDANRVATITAPDVNWNGSEQITFTATDPSALSNSDQAVFAVTPVNDPPVVADIPSQTVVEGASFTSINLDDYVSDVDNADADIVWTFAGNTQLSVSITNRVAIVTAPSADWNGTETITFTATDIEGLKDSDPASFTVTAVNDPPVVTNIPNQTIDEGQTFLTIPLDDYVSDVDNLDAEMSWGWVGNNQLTVSLDVNRVATITIPSADWNGSEVITFEATDPGGLTDSDPATFTVTAINDAPVVADIPDQTVDEGTSFATVSLDNFVSDVDNVDSDISWTFAGNTELTVTIDANRIATIGIPSSTWNGSETITFTATDPGLLADSDAATFTVSAVNNAPVVTDIPNQTIAEGATFTTINLDDFVSDVDDIDADMTWTYAGNTELTVSIDLNRVATITTPSLDWNGSEAITFTATDPGGLSDADPATFTVTGINDAPVVADIPDQTVAEGASFATIALDDYVSDVDNLDSEISWSVGGNTELTVSISVDRVATVTIPSPTWNGAETITFTATDPGLLTDSDAATFTVTSVNNAPVVTNIPDQTISEGGAFTTISLDDFVSDVDNADSEIDWSFSGNTNLTVSIDVNRVATITIPGPDYFGAETITFTATDPSLLSNSDAATFTVTAVNDAPVVADIPNQAITEGESFATINLDDFVSDVDNLDSDMTWSYAGNAELTVSIVNRVAIVSLPTPDWNGSETITFTATDPGGLSDFDPATFSVAAVNDRPNVTDIPNQTIAEGETFATINLDDYVTDVDNLVSEINWSWVGNSQLTVSIDVNRVATITIPNVNYNGSETITFSATDPAGLSDSDPAVFTVTAVNDAPVVADIPDQSIAEGATFATIALDNFVSDVDNADSTIAWTATGETELTVSIDANRVATISIPDVNWNGSETITFTATDPGALSDADAATFTVGAVNDAPVVTDIPNQTIAEGAAFATITLDDFVSDLDNTDAEMTWTTSGETELTVSIDANRVATITIPDVNWNGSETITFTATDPGSLFDSDPATFTVTAVNDAPVLATIGAQSVDEAVQLTIPVSAADIDGDVLTLTTSTLPSTSTFVDNGNGTGEFNWTPSYIESGVYSVTFYVSDGAGAADSEAVSITVNEVGNQPPVLDPIGPRSTQETVNLNFDVTATDAEDTPSLRAENLPGNATFVDNGDGSGTFDWTPGFVDAGSFDVLFIAEDDTLAADSELVTITVGDANRTPTAEAGPDQFEIPLGQLVTLDGTASSDPDNDPLNYTWTQVAGPSTSLNGATTAGPTFTPNEIGIYEFELVVDDNIDSSAPDTVAIEAVNAAPPQAITDLAISIAGDDIQLAWSAATVDTSGLPTNVDHYTIYRGTRAYFTPSAIDSIGVTDEFTTSFTDNNIDGADVVGDTTTNYFYVVEAVDIYGNRSLVSNRVGQYDYQLVTTATADFNLVAIPFENTGITDAVSLIAAIGTANVNTANNYNASSQSWEARFAAGFGVNFAVTVGGVYQINARAATVFSVAGSVPDPGSVSSPIITTATTDFNYILIPFEYEDQFSVAQDVIDNVPGLLNTLNNFVAGSQNYESRFAVGFGTNFPVRAGKPYQANAAGTGTFPAP